MIQYTCSFYALLVGNNINALLALSQCHGMKQPLFYTSLFLQLSASSEEKEELWIQKLQSMRKERLSANPARYRELLKIWDKLCEQRDTSLTRRCKILLDTVTIDSKWIEELLWEDSQPKDPGWNLPWIGTFILQQDIWSSLFLSTQCGENCSKSETNCANKETLHWLDAVRYG